MKIGVENKGASPLYVAGVMIPAGETRHFDEHEVPPEMRPAPVAEAEPEQQDELAAILDGKVGEILAGLSVLTIEAVSALLAREEAAAKPRKTLVEGLQAALIERASTLVEPGANGGEVSGGAGGEGA